MRISELREPEYKTPSGDDFHETMTHETSPRAAEKIRKEGFKRSETGIFFNRPGANYSGGGYGGTIVKAEIEGPIDGVLNLTERMPNDLDELADADEIAQYCRRNRKWAWFDELQFVVLEPRFITVIH